METNRKMIKILEYWKTKIFSYIWSFCCVSYTKNVRQQSIFLQNFRQQSVLQQNFAFVELTLSNIAKCVLLPPFQLSEEKIQNLWGFSIISLLFSAGNRLSAKPISRILPGVVNAAKAIPHSTMINTVITFLNLNSMIYWPHSVAYVVRLERKKRHGEREKNAHCSIKSIVYLHPSHSKRKVRTGVIAIIVSISFQAKEVNGFSMRLYCERRACTKRTDRRRIVSLRRWMSGDTNRIQTKNHFRNSLVIFWNWTDCNSQAAYILKHI